MTDHTNDDNGRLSVLAEVANDSIDRLEWASEQSRWRGALCRAIQSDLLIGDGQLAKDLVGLAMYLEESHRNALNDYVQQTEQQLNGLGLRY